MIQSSTNIAGNAARLLSVEGKVAIVTGAGSGIGRGISLRLAEFGAAVAILDIDDVKASQTDLCQSSKTNSP